MLAGIAVAVAAAVVLGEYGYDGWAVIGSGIVVGLFVAEAMVAVARTGSRPLAAIAGVLAACSLLGAMWTSSGHRLGAVGWKGWTGVALAAGAAAVRARPPGAARRSRSAPAATE